MAELVLIILAIRIISTATIRVCSNGRKDQERKTMKKPRIQGIMQRKEWQYGVHVFVTGKPKNPTNLLINI